MDWLLGVHAPAGSSWGRYAHALGDDMYEALGALNELEREFDGDVLRLDVAYAPSREVADLCCTPALRDAALAVSSWPEDGAVTPQQCQIANEPGSLMHRAIAVAGQRLRIAPLHRVRSTTAPRSATRALLGDALRRQHAPWALTWGPLAQLTWLPRVRLDGYVIAPQSWALPADRDEASLAAWRAREGVDRRVQVGTEDVLLPIDLDRPEQRAQLRDPSLQRVHEIWPPLGRELDGARRVELVCAVLDVPVAELPPLGVAAPPSEDPADPTWRTLVLFSARRHHDTLLPTIVAFAERRATAWFVLPYIDDEGEQLRVRLQGRSPDALMTALLGALAPFVERGLVSTTQVRPYHPERARYGKALASIERLFQADSHLLVEPRDERLPAEAHVAIVFEAMVRGLGLPTDVVDERAAATLGSEVDAPAYRAVQRQLAALLDEPPAWSALYAKRVRTAKLKKAEAARLLPTLLHMTAVRHLGPDREAEVRALYLWTRARRSRAARGR
ncbi:MAG: thiopeptide-type bacteriocin biosynthesis protein [Polyangia bacterium]